MVQTKKQQIKKLKEELKWLEENPFYIGRDGLPDIWMLLFIVITGFILGSIIILIYKKNKKNKLKQQIKKLTGDKK